MLVGLILIVLLWTLGTPRPPSQQVRPGAWEKLTGAQRAALTLLAREGLTNAEIGQRLGWEEWQVKKLLTRLYGLVNIGGDVRGKRVRLVMWAWSVPAWRALAGEKTPRTVRRPEDEGR